MPMPYQPQILDALNLLQASAHYDPRHIEAFMRAAAAQDYGEVGRPTALDHLSPFEFRHEVGSAIASIREDGTDFAEKLAKFYGL